MDDYRICAECLYVVFEPAKAADVLPAYRCRVHEEINVVTGRRVDGDCYQMRTCGVQGWPCCGPQGMMWERRPEKRM